MNENIEDLLKDFNEFKNNRKYNMPFSICVRFENLLNLSYCEVNDLKYDANYPEILAIINENNRMIGILQYSDFEFKFSPERMIIELHYKK